jgi:hypothetical protein
MCVFLEVQFQTKDKYQVLDIVLYPPQQWHFVKADISQSMVLNLLYLSIPAKFLPT